MVLLWFSMTLSHMSLLDNRLYTTKILPSTVIRPEMNLPIFLLLIPPLCIVVWFPHCSVLLFIWIYSKCARWTWVDHTSWDIRYSHRTSSVDAKCLIIGLKTDTVTFFKATNKLTPTYYCKPYERIVNNYQSMGIYYRFLIDTSI